jgi:hypothetical protein
MGNAKRGAGIDQRVADVVAIIGRHNAHVDKIEQAIRSLDAKQQPDTALWPWPPIPLNTRDKKIARSIGRAIGRLEKQLRRHDGGGVLLRAVYGEHSEFIEWQALLEHWRGRFETFGGKAQTDAGMLFENSPTTWPLGHPKPSADRFVRKHNAVAAAAAILESHGQRPTATQKSGTRKSSVFCRVAAVLYGDTKARLYHQCRIFIKARNRARK